MYGNYPSGVDGSAGLGMAVLLCWGLFMLVGLALFALNIWMLVDSLGRQEYEFPNSTGNSKNLWVILLAVGLVLGFGWIVALVYYFKVYKVIRRGTVAPPWAGQPYGQPPAAPGYPPAYAPPAPPAYAPPQAPVPPTPPAPPAAPVSPEVPPAPPVPDAPEPPEVPPAPPAPPAS